MDATERKEKAKLHYDLINILAQCGTDDDFHQRLLWALELITRELVHWKDSDEDECIYEE